MSSLPSLSYRSSQLDSVDAPKRNSAPVCAIGGMRLSVVTRKPMCGRRYTICDSVAQLRRLTGDR